VTTIILGASSGLGRALGRELAADGANLVLIGRDKETLEAEAAHLRLSFGVAATPWSADPGDLESFARAMGEASKAHEPIDALFCPIGASFPKDDGLQSGGDVRTNINTNVLSIVTAVKAVLPGMIAREGGEIVAFSSIAAVRGRGANVVYAASKCALESYVESLDHLTASSGIRVIVYRMGYMATQQSFGKALLFPAVDPERAAKHIVAGYRRARGRRTYPRFWIFLTALVRLLPRWIFLKLKF
jgi:short-subunit dehydrogenase